MNMRATLRRLFGAAFFLDQARPVEWISLLYLGAWLQFLMARPEDFAGGRYSAFSALSPAIWAILIAAIIASQLVAMWPSRHAPLIRFGAMSMAAAIWSVVALQFWSQAAPLLARGHTVLALAAFTTAVYLGLRSVRS